jgi:hypothetical protein
MIKDHLDAADEYASGNLLEVAKWLRSTHTSKISVLLFVDQLVAIGSAAYPKTTRSKKMDHLEAINAAIELLTY